MSLDYCPGRYCGRLLVNTTAGVPIWGECGACPSGFRVNMEYHCSQCTGKPTLFQWLYLGFMATLPLVLHWFYLLHKHTEWKKNVAIQCGFAFIETTLAAVFTLLSFEPKGSLSLVTCSVQQISDWYTIFFNPRIKFVETVRCSQEAVYPLYSIIFLFYLFSLALMLFLRPTLAARFLTSEADKKKCNVAIYAALYFHPILVVIHAICAGLIYYAYPYLTILATMTGLAVYAVYWDMKVSRNVDFSLIFAITMCFCLQKPKDVFGEHRVQNIFIILWHLTTLAYSIIALGNAYTTSFTYTSFAYLAFVPLPLLFLLLTEQCTDPNHITVETGGMPL
uniref:JNK1/MAPK8-associated membrane protein n=1 Tax=Phallusia mammillata TaxID=59560 RepID=A0A6F9DG00_9ASCI|nr:JNK1/MAPK8-associated membrane protein [Phallusia mammillata]